MAEYDAETSTVTGFLIDLDGTMYSPDGLLPGALHFFQWLLDSKHPFAFLSNTGAKGSMQVQQKLCKEPFALSPNPISLRHIFTAAEAQMQLLVDVVPERGRLYIQQGGDGSFLNSLRMCDPLLVDSWELRTHLTENEAKEWSVYAREYLLEHGKPGVFVVHFTDGTVTKMHDPITGEIGYADWNYSVFRKSTYLLTNGAQLIYTADDAFNPSVDSEYPGMLFPLPGPGMFAECLRKAMFPSMSTSTFIACAGKGGNRGGQYMMQHALKMLKQQGHSGRLDDIMMIGDRFDTDIRGGNSIGIATCLVESGCHSRDQQKYYPDDIARYVAKGVGDLIPKSFVKSEESAEQLGRKLTVGMFSSAVYGLDKEYNAKVLRESAKGRGFSKETPERDDGEVNGDQNGAFVDEVLE
mmetsp:Transcript_6096/g.10823  ORF Transcript_6096/g.10823 Transcript_6096/m.10823 type:complete len:410 (-) Transcript_6096:1809-3038(-)